MFARSSARPQVARPGRLQSAWPWRSGVTAPNVLVIMTDQQQATSLGLYGNPDVRTPHLARLAAGGLLYRRAFTAHPLCVPSRASFWTGRWPHSTGVRTNEIPLPVS